MVASQHSVRASQEASARAEGSRRTSRRLGAVLLGMHALGLVPAWLGEPALVPKLLVLVLTAVPVVLLMWIPSSRLRHPASGGVLFVTTLVLGLWLLIWALATQYDGLWGFSMLFVPWLVGPWVILLLALFLLRLLNVVQETRDGP